jgi:hypothetical protein
VAVKALPLAAACKSLIRHARTITEQSSVASEAVLLNDLFPGFPDEIVLSEDIVVWHMTGITIGDSLMGAV